jgi:2-aminoadipate transaminase
MRTTSLPQGMEPNTISLLLGHPDPSTLLMPELREAMQHVISSPQASTMLQYGLEQGTQSLIEALREKINREQGCSLQPANLMIVAGSTHAVDMLARLYARAGGVVLVEAPTYVDALHVFRDHQIELCAIPMDEDGLIPGALEKQVAQLHTRGTFPSMLYTVPNFHNPTGRTLSEARRIEIIRLARRYNFLIVEDDVYRDLSFEGEVPASFYALASGKQVLSIGSFSKTLAPGLRLGWLLGSEKDIQHCVNSGTTQMGGGANPFMAHMIAEHCRSGAWEKHILSLQSLYKMRRDRALSALERYMPADVKWTHPAGGFFIWLSLPEQVFAQEVKRLALQQGVLLAAGEGFFAHPADGEHHLRLAYSCAAPGDIDAGIRILAQVINSYSKKDTPFSTTN